MNSSGETTGGSMRAMLDEMSVEEKVGQVFVFTFTSLPQALADMDMHPGGFVRIYSDALTMARQSVALQVASKIPLFLSADFERGIGSTVSGAIDVATLMCIGATGDLQCATDSARIIAEEALAMGVNMNYVPVLDVNINPLNPIINTRSFGASPEMVARMGAAFIRGTQDAGVAACGKHFPGHGDTTADSHTDLAVVDADRDRLNRVELLPFRAAIDAGVDAIMSAHLLVPSLEPDHLPATLSRRVLQSLLREELGFTGMVVSDALDMGAIARNYPPEKAIPVAVNAGCDQLIMPANARKSYKILLQAVGDGVVSEARLDEAVGRILATKQKRGVLHRTDCSPSDLPDKTMTNEHQSVALDIALKGVTLARNEAGILPLAAGTKVACILISNAEDSRSYYLDPKTIGAHLALQGLEVETFNAGTLDERNGKSLEAGEYMAAASRADVIILAAYMKVIINSGTVGLAERYVRFAFSLRDMGKPIILVSFGSPYLERDIPGTDAYVCAYGATEPIQKATALLLTGKKPWLGSLPV